MRTVPTNSFGLCLSCGLSERECKCLWDEICPTHGITLDHCWAGKLSCPLPVKKKVTTSTPAVGATPQASEPSKLQPTEEKRQQSYERAMAQFRRYPTIRWRTHKYFGEIHPQRDGSYTTVGNPQDPHEDKRQPTRGFFRAETLEGIRQVIRENCGEFLAESEEALTTALESNEVTTGIAVGTKRRIRKPREPKQVLYPEKLRGYTFRLPQGLYAALQDLAYKNKTDCTCEVEKALRKHLWAPAAAPVPGQNKVFPVQT